MLFETFLIWLFRMDISITLIYRKIQIWITYATKKKFQETLAKIREEGDYLYILQKSSRVYQYSSPFHIYGAER